MVVRSLLAFLTAGLVLGYVSDTAIASKQAIAYFGTESGPGSLGGQFKFPSDVAVNSTGAGVADKGDIYVVDQFEGTLIDQNNRIQRFKQNDNGTPSNPYDDRYEFVSAWGAGVDGAIAGSGYEICTIATECQAGLETGGDGTVAGNGALSRPMGIAIDQDSGDVYVVDSQNFRINVYEGDGTFVRAFGWDVVASGPSNAGTGYEVCTGASGDICKQGLPGSGAGQIGGSGNGSAGGVAVTPPDGNPATGTVFLADRENRRISTYGLDGSSPSSFGSPTNFAQFSPQHLAVDSRGIVYATDSNDGGEIDRYDSQNANGNGVGFLASIPAPPLSSTNIQAKGLEVDADLDGGGPEVDSLYVLRDGVSGTTVVQQLGPVNAPGLTDPPAAADDEHGALAAFNFVGGMGLDESNGRLFLDSAYNIGGPYEDIGPNGVYVLDTAGGAPNASLESLSDITSTSVTLHGAINPNGPPAASYHAEYSLDGSNWIPGPSTLLGSQESAQSVTVVITPPGGGLEPSTLYHVRLVATRPFNPPATSSELTFTTANAPPLVETTGSPVRTAGTAQLGGRVIPRNSPTTYHFEYGAEGPCSDSPCTATDPRSAGDGGVVELVSETVGPLDPGTTYHYRLVAESSATASPVFGEDMTVVSRASDAQLSHGRFPGPPGSDRAWEQVNTPDTGGNPTEGTYAVSDDGTRAIYRIAGGTPISDTGSYYNQYFAERTPSGWLTKFGAYPPRDELVGASWLPPSGRADLSSLIAMNFTTAGGDVAAFRVGLGGQPAKVYQAPLAEYGQFFETSDDASRVVMGLKGSPDPQFPVAAGAIHLYDVTSGAPKLIDVLPSGAAPKCGVSGAGMPESYARRFEHWLSADGSLAFFPSFGDHCKLGEVAPARLYVRDIDSGTTELMSPPPLSGVECDASFRKAVPGAVFFLTKSRLAAEDANPSGCNDAFDSDIYRFDLDQDIVKCITCAVGGGAGGTAIAEDGSRLYFESKRRLLPGAPAGVRVVYRLDLRNGDLAFVGPLGSGRVGELGALGNAITPDGSTFVFRSDASGLNPLGGAKNGGTDQYYRYDDRDRSLICVSCPQDGKLPGGPVRLGLMDGEESGPNKTPLADDGTFAFVTDDALVSADQNTAAPEQKRTAGRDAYEWRDGRLLLISDGLTDWSDEGPVIGAISADGRDVFFSASAQLTPDALDGYRRVYDARIGGGFTFPSQAKPCPLEVCQGIPKGLPEEASPGTSNFAGPGNKHPRHHRKAKKKKRHHKHNARRNHKGKATR